MRRRFWEAVARYAMRRAGLGYVSPPFQVSHPTATTGADGFTVTYSMAAGVGYLPGER